MTELRLFFDANELIRLALAYHGDMAPAVLRSEHLEVSGDPIAVLWIVAAEGEVVNGQRLVVFSSVETLKLIRAKLAEVYRWDSEILDEFTRIVVRVVKSTGGQVHRGSPSPLRYGPLTDAEDRHRLAEASACQAEVFVTEDGEVLDAWRTDPTLRPIAVSAREIVERLRLGRREQ